MPSGARPSLLVVDDEPVLRIALRRSLNGRFDVGVAANAMEAMRLFRERPVDLVLTDFNMPGRTGAGLATDLRELGFLGPIVILTGADVSDELRAAVDSGLIHRVLTKPWVLDELVATLDGALPRAA